MCRFRCFCSFFARLPSTTRPHHRRNPQNSRGSKGPRKRSIMSYHACTKECVIPRTYTKKGIAMPPCIPGTCVHVFLSRRAKGKSRFAFLVCSFLSDFSSKDLDHNEIGFTLAYAVPMMGKRKYFHGARRSKVRPLATRRCIRSEL